MSLHVVNVQYFNYYVYSYDWIELYRYFQSYLSNIPWRGFCLCCLSLFPLTTFQKDFDISRKNFKWFVMSHDENRYRYGKDKFSRLILREKKSWSFKMTSLRKSQSVVGVQEHQVWREIKKEPVVRGGSKNVSGLRNWGLGTKSFWKSWGEEENWRVEKDPTMLLWAMDLNLLFMFFDECK